MTLLLLTHIFKRMDPNEKRENDFLSYLPQNLRSKLLPFQREGVKYGVQKNGRVLIADEMGLGKTLQALCVAYYYKELWPLLILAPSCMRYPWAEELEKWFPEILPGDINIVQSGSDIREIPTAKVTIATYGLLSRGNQTQLLVEALINQNFNVVIADESHYFKNRKANTTKIAVPLIQAAQHKLLLTGTPALSRPSELFPQIDALCPGHFGTWSEYAKRYCDAHMRFFGRNNRRWDTNGASNLQELQSKLVNKLMIRRLKKDVLTQLPPKRRQKIPFELKPSEFKKEVDRMREEIDKVISCSKMNMSDVMKNNNQTQDSGLFQLRKLMMEMYNATGKAKIGPVCDYVKMLLEDSSTKVLLFSHHLLMMDGIQQHLRQNKVKFIRIDGSVASEDRMHYVKQFQSDPEVRVAILSILAAGQGITLTAGNIVVFAELHWTPGQMEQCEDRAHRIGQKDSVTVHYLVARNTLDEWMWSLLSKKTCVVTTALNGKTQKLSMDAGEDSHIQKLSNAEAWVPSQVPEEEESIGSFFQSQQLSNQKSVLDYFSPSVKNKGKRNKSGSQGKCSSRLMTPQIEVIDLDHECEDDFKDSSNKRKRCVSTANQTKSRNIIKEEVTSRDEMILNPEDNDQTCGGDDSLPSVVPVSGHINEAPVTNINDSAVTDMVHTHTSKEVTHTPVAMESTPTKSSLPNVDNSTPQVTKADFWPCSVCTYHNDLSVIKCDMCSTPSGKRMRTTDGAAHALCNSSYLEEEDDLPVIATPKTLVWVCLVCTYENTKRCKKCKMCNTKKGECVASQEKINTAGSGHSDLCNKDNLTKGAGRESAADGANSGEGSSDVKHKMKRVESADVDFETESNDMFDISPNDVANNGAKIENRDDEIQDNESQSKDTVLANEVNASGDETDMFDDAVIVLDSDDDFDMHVPQSSTSQSSGTVSNCNEEPQSGTNDLTEDMIAAEIAASQDIFCDDDSMDEMIVTDQLSGETEPLGEVSAPPPAERMVDLDSVPVYDVLKFCASQNTSRIHLFNQSDEPLGVNFQPLDVEALNWSELPDLFFHAQNLRLVRRFIRDWNSLSETKKRMVCKSGSVFSSPYAAYLELRSGSKNTTQRYLTKTDVSAAAAKKAEEVNGSVRQIYRNPKAASSGKLTSSNKTSPAKGASPKQNMQAKLTPTLKTSTHKQKWLEEMNHKAGPSGINGAASVVHKLGTGNVGESSSTNEPMKKAKQLASYTQVIGKDGIPLCIACHKPFDTQLLTKNSVTNDDMGWQTRFCSPQCKEDHWMKSSREYTRKVVFQAEHGICQKCKFNAEDFFDQIRTSQSLEKRASMIKGSIYNALSHTTKENMVRKPFQGLFWHVDHIQPVYAGGGQCDVDNLQTLCTVCHQKVTAEQCRQRAKQRKFGDAAKFGDITAFFRK